MTPVLTGIKCCSRPPCPLPSILNSCLPAWKKKNCRVRIQDSFKVSLASSATFGLNSAAWITLSFSFKPQVLMEILCLVHIPGLHWDVRIFVFLKWEKNEKVWCLRPGGRRMNCTQRNHVSLTRVNPLNQTSRLLSALTFSLSRFLHQALWY